MKVLDEFYGGLNEPLQSYMLALRRTILDIDPGIEETWKWSTPFFLYHKKMLCYLWLDKKTGEPYLSVYGDSLKHPALVQKHQAKIKKIILNVNQDIPKGTIKEILTEAQSRMKK